jgi:hypothetical protein
VDRLKPFQGQVIYRPARGKPDTSDSDPAGVTFHYRVPDGRRLRTPAMLYPVARSPGPEGQLWHGVMIYTAPALGTWEAITAWIEGELAKHGWVVQDRPFGWGPALTEDRVDALSTAPTPCCGKSADAIGWNPGNNAVQCHHCGMAYTCAVDGQENEILRLKGVIARNNVRARAVRDSVLRLQGERDALLQQLAGQQDRSLFDRVFGR